MADPPRDYSAETIRALFAINGNLLRIADVLEKLEKLIALGVEQEPEPSRRDPAR
jgi:hypothetical protein